MITICASSQVTGSGPLAGDYSYHSVSSPGSYPSQCADGCLYHKDGDSSTSFCFEDGGEYDMVCDAGASASTSSVGAAGGAGSQASYCSLDSDHTMCKYQVS